MFQIVLKRNRKLSKIEYVQKYYDLCDYFNNRLIKVSRRRQPTLCEPIWNILARINVLITQVSDEFFSYGIKLYDKPDQARMIINEIHRLYKPLIVLWINEKYLQKDINNMTEIINDEIAQVAKYGEIIDVNYMKVLNKFELNQAEFIKNMCELNRLIHSKVIGLKYNYKIPNGLPLINLADTVLYELIFANDIVPETKDQYEERRKYLSTAYNNLKAMEQHMYVIFTALEFSEREELEWVELYDKECRLLSTLIKSDKTRFGDLK